MTARTKVRLMTVVALLALGNVCAQVSTVQFTKASYSVNENGASVTLTVERIGEPGGTASVEYATRDGTATNGEDYVAQGDVLYFNGEINMTIVIPILNDAVAERDKTFSVFLFDPDPFDAELGAVTNSVVTILDDDRGVEFSGYSFAVDEGAGTAVVTVQASTESTNGFSVEYSFDSCSATAGSDYLAQGGTLSFVPGETEKTILVPIIDDALAEGDEAVSLRLSNPVGVTLGALSNAVLRIQDDDPPSDSDVELVPRKVGAWSSTQGSVWSVAVAGNYAYVSSIEGLDVLDVSTAASPQLVGHAAAESGEVVVLCDRAFVGGEIFDISQPSNPQRLGTMSVPGRSRALAIDGNRAYVGFNGGPCDLQCPPNGLAIADVSDATNPRELGVYYSIYPSLSVAVSGNYAYLAHGYPYLSIIDVGDPTNPREVAGLIFVPDLGFYFFAYQAVVLGQRLYLTAEAIPDSGSYYALLVFDIHDPISPRYLGSFRIFEPMGSPNVFYVLPLVVAGAYAFVTSPDGLKVINIHDPANLRLVAAYGTQWGPLAVSDSYAYIAGIWGLEIVDLNPLGFRTGSIARLPSGQMQFTLNTRYGRSYTVQATTNLVDWEPLETRTAFDTKLTFTDTNAPGFSRRFYRAVSP